MSKIKNRGLVALAVSALLLTAVPAANANSNNETEPAAPDCEYQAWETHSIYEAGDRVSHLGEQYEAKWWTMLEQPGTTSEWGVWNHLGSCDDPDDDGYVVGYYTNWGEYNVKDIVETGSAEKLTHIIYAFGNVENGECTIGDEYEDFERAYDASESVDGVADDPDQDLKGNFNQILKLKEQYPDIQVLWSFGGWTWSGGFDEAAEDPEHFASSCHDLVNNPEWDGVFDGIDIDWEYPGDCGDTCSDAPYEAYPNLMSALRDEFGTDWLTAAISADARDGGKLDNADYASAAEFIDFYMVMTYDFFGSWEPEGPVAPHSSLHCYDDIPIEGFCSEYAIDKLNEMGIGEEKLLLGVPFYGRGWEGVESPEPGSPATDAATGPDRYHDLIEHCPATETVGGSAYGFCDGEWWSYDTPETAESKAQWAADNDLAGVFFWELSGDRDGELITGLHTGING